MAHFVLSLVLAALFLVTGAGKLLGLPFAVRNRDRLAVSPAFWMIAGVLEWAGAFGLVFGIIVPGLGVAAASGLALLMIGAIVARLRAARRTGVPDSLDGAATGGLARPIASDAGVLASAALTAVLIILGV